MKKISRQRPRAVRPTKMLQSKHVLGAQANAPAHGKEPEALDPVISGSTPEGSSLLARAKAHWMVGEWLELTQLEQAEIEAHSERDRLALLVACAHQHLGDHERTRHYVRMALAWRCDPRLIARLLISDLHSTFGRISALKGDDESMRAHFVSTLSVTGEPANNAAMSLRAIRELASVGLLMEAATLVKEQSASLHEAAKRPLELSAHIEILRSEVELLQHELALAQKRRQIGPAASHGGPGGVVQDNEASEDELRARSTSQLGQDLWVLERSDSKRNGFFVEFGATDGIVLSNTYLLEREFGWQGICIEPNPTLFAKLKGNRACTVSDACIGATTGMQVSFIAADVYGGMEPSAFGDMHAQKRDAYRRAGCLLNLTTISLNDLLVQLNAPRDIDYMSVDTEGSELEILSAFPFDDWRVRLLTVEHNFSPNRPALRALMSSHGYRCTEREFDDFFEKTFEN